MGAYQRLAGRRIRSSIAAWAPNRILHVEATDVIVATGTSPASEPVPIAWVQEALDQLARDGESGGSSG
ncbi:MAG: hypothetical protein ACYC65_05070 [Candidatus Limnocylindrales bacterium]